MADDAADIQNIIRGRESLYDAGTALIRAAYWRHVRMLAETVAAADDVDAYDVIFEVCDGSEWVIYPGKAILTLYASDHESAYTEFGAFPTQDGEPDWSSAAFSALREDVTATYQADYADD